MKEFALEVLNGALNLLAVLTLGLAICQLWSWFVAEPFGLKSIGLAHALGLSALVNLFFFGIYSTLTEAFAGANVEKSVGLKLFITGAKVLAPIASIMVCSVLHGWM